MTKQRTFDETRRLAGHLGRKFKTVEEKLPYHREISGKAERLLAIHETLTFIGETPNASVNDAALAAMDKEVVQAIEALKGWVKDLFQPDEEDEDIRDLYLDDEIPF